jgi:3-dehydroquinate synthase
MIKKLLGPFKEKILIVDSLESNLFDSKHSLLFIDENLKNFDEIKKLKAKHQIFWLQAGEDLKSLDGLKSVLGSIEPLISKIQPPYCFVAVGGGSLGDFCGFLASVYHRGVDFIQCPSTWLAAIDSSHGGKTALNVLNFKNQIGTYYPAKQIIISKSLLAHQSPTKAMGEITKTILLSSQNSKLRNFIDKAMATDVDTIWNSITDFIKVKNTYVKKDPREKKKERFKLNLGHTVGHALEKVYGLPHSEAVLRGVIFAVTWSVKKKYSHIRMLQVIFHFLEVNQFFLHTLPKKPQQEFESALLKDKKRAGQDINFVFLQNFKAVIKKVTVKDIISELKNQGLISK